MSTDVFPATSRALAVRATTAGGINGIWSQRGTSYDCDSKCALERGANDKSISVPILSTVDIIIYIVCLNALLVFAVLIDLWDLRARARQYLLWMKQIVACMLASLLKRARATSPVSGSSSREFLCPWKRLESGWLEQSPATRDTSSSACSNLSWTVGREACKSALIVAEATIREAHENLVRMKSSCSQLAAGDGFDKHGWR